jgi:hypothetical protein
MSRIKRVIHFRRCHVCGAVTEQEEKIENCRDCHKPIVPFLYYDDTIQVGVASEGPRPKTKEGEWRPVIGLTAYW